MPLTVTVKIIAECLRTDCNILGYNNKKLYGKYVIPVSPGLIYIHPLLLQIVKRYNI